MDKFQFRSEIEPRIEWLQKQGKNIEAFFFLCIILEQELISLIELYENHSARLVRGHKLNLLNFRKNKFKKMTLGLMKDYLMIFTGDGALIKELDFFIELRNDCVHRISNNLPELDSKVSKNINRYYRLVFWLLRRQNKLLKSEIRSNHHKLKKSRGV